MPHYNVVSNKVTLATSPGSRRLCPLPLRNDQRPGRSEPQLSRHGRSPGAGGQPVILFEQCGTLLELLAGDGQGRPLEGQ